MLVWALLDMRTTYLCSCTLICRRCLPDDGPGIIKTIANSTQHGVGADKYALGFKGGWPSCVNASEPDTCVFDAEAKATVRYVREELGVKHAARWCDAPRSQGEWDAWGYFLHGDTSNNR